MTWKAPEEEGIWGGGDSERKKVVEEAPGEGVGGEEALGAVWEGEVDLRVPESGAVVETGGQMTEDRSHISTC